MHRAFLQRQTLDCDLKRQPNFGCAGKIKSRRENSHDVVAATIELQELANYSAASGKMPSPKSITNKGNRPPAGSIFFRSKGATQHRFHSQGRQIACRNAGAPDPLRFALPGQVKRTLLRHATGGKEMTPVAIGRVLQEGCTERIKSLPQ